jgi:hypothetical protein
MRRSPPPAVIIGRSVTIRGPLGVAVNIDTGSVTGPGRPLPPISPAHAVRATSPRSR